MHAEEQDKDIDLFNEALSEEIEGEERIMLNQVHFPKGHELQFSGTWHEELTIRGCHFYGAVNLSGKDLPPGCSFAETTFHHKATFEGSRFPQGCGGAPSFRDATFYREANFEDCRFRDGDDLGDASFVEATFKEGANFQDARFRKIKLSNAEIGGSISFRNSVFETISLWGANDIGDSENGSSLMVYPAKNEVKCQISAPGADFHLVEIGGMKGGSINLKGVSIESNLYILGDAVTGGIDLSKVEVGGFVEMEDVRLRDCALKLRGADFDGSVGIEDCKFSRPITVEALKTDPSSFSLQSCTFEEGLHLEGDSPSNRLFSSTDDVDLTNLSFGPDCTVSMRNVDLSRTRLLDTDMRDVELTGVTWTEKTALYGIRRQAVHDEVHQEEGEDPDYRKLERLYRELKQSFESRKSWYHAGHFHIGEKEMQRRGSESRLRRAMLRTYRLVSLYGERAIPAIVGLVIFLVLFAFIYVGWGLKLTDCNAALAIRNVSGQHGLWSFLHGLNFSVQHIGFGRATGYELESGGQFLTVFQRLICTTLVALAALAIRQQLKR